MKSRNLRERGVKKSTYRAFNALQSELKNPVTKAPTCPYCGSPMLYEHRSKRIDTYHDHMMYVCKNYPECDCFCRAREHKGKRYLVSTPANKQLRMLRNEAHYYFKQILDYNIYESEATLYSAISPKLPIYTSEIVHIGECKEAGCKSIIDVCIDILYANKDKVTNFRKWEGTETDPERMKKLSELSSIDNKEK